MGSLPTVDDLLGRIVEESGDFLAALDGEGRFLAFNRAHAAEFERIFGRPPEVGSSMAEAMEAMPAPRERLLAMLRRALAGESFTMIQSLEVPGDRTRTYEVSFRPLLDEGGRIRGTVHVARDVTALARAEAERELLGRIILALAEATTLEGALSEALTRICELTGWATGDAWLPDPSGAVLRRAAGVDHPDEHLRRFHAASAGTAFAPGEGLPGRVWQAGNSEWVRDVTGSPDFSRSEPALEAGLRAAVAVPVTAAGAVVAVLCFYSYDARQEDPGLIGLVSAVAAQLGLVIRRRRTEADLRRVTAYYEALLNHIPDLAWLKDRDSRYVAVNDAFLRAYGRTREEVLGRSDEVVYAAEDAERYRGEDLRVMTAGEDLVMEEREIAPGGGIRYFETIKTAFRDETGDVAGTVGIARDVTGRKRRQQQEGILAKAGLVLASSLAVDETVRGVAELLVPELGDWCAVEVRDPAGGFRCVEVCAATAEGTELLRSFQDTHPADPIGVAGLVDEVARTGEPRRIAVTTDDVLRKSGLGADQRERMRRSGAVSCMIVPMLARGRSIGVLTLALTEVGRSFDERDAHLAEELARYAAMAIDNALLHQAAQTAQDLAERAVHTRDEVLGVVAHDLRNPLSALALLIDLLAGSAGPADGHLRSMQQITDQMDRLIQDLLDVRRMEEGHLALHRTCLPIGSAPLRAEELLSLVAAERGVRLDVARPAGDLRVLADPDRIQQVFSNLVGNAVKVSSRGGVIDVRCEVRVGEVVFSVSDTGPGIPGDQIDDVFREFWQGPGMRQRGAGLGLPIARGIVEAHGGHIGVESAPGRGSTFFFSLPRCNLCDADPERRPAECRGSGTHSPWPSE
jgi:PAS domain S-box-containing protein